MYIAAYMVDERRLVVGWGNVKDGLRRLHKQYAV